MDATRQSVATPPPLQASPEIQQPSKKAATQLGAAVATFSSMQQKMTQVDPMQVQDAWQTPEAIAARRKLTVRRKGIDTKKEEDDEEEEEEAEDKEEELNEEEPTTKETLFFLEKKKPAEEKRSLGSR